jgi:hypothetical protein
MMPPNPSLSGKRSRPKGLQSYDIKVPNQKAFEIDTPDDQVKMHQLLLAVAKKGSGKSTAVCNLLSFLKKDKVLDRLFVITSSWESNKPLFDFLKLPIDKEDVYNPDFEARETMEDIIEKVTQETREYDDYRHKLYLHNQMKRALRKVKTDRDIGNLDPELLIGAYNDDCIESAPEHRYNGKKPVIGIFVDDCQSTPLFTSRPFLNMCIRHRHIGSSEDTRMGVSVFICVQNYTAQHGGIPKAIRDNVTLMMLYKTRSSSVLKTIMEDISDQITDEEFFDTYNKATEGDHDFLFIDWHPKKHRFRKNFNEYIPVPSDDKKHISGTRRNPKDRRAGGDDNSNIPKSIKDSIKGR